MDSEAEAMDFSGWELLHDSNDVNVDFDSEASPLPLIRTDHFSLNPNPNPNPNSNSSSNSSSTDHSDLDRNFDDSYVANQLFQSSTSNLHLWNSHSDSDCDTTLIDTTTAASAASNQSSDAAAAFDSKDEEEDEEEQKHKGEDEEEGEQENRVVWWKVPFDIFKYWVVRVSPVPVWSLSVAAAAAFLGLVILGRRLYKMKRKTQTLKLNVALDDKKVSQLMGRVARLNEAFSVVKRVPIVRPSLPASSVTLRPVMSMR